MTTNTTLFSAEKGIRAANKNVPLCWTYGFWEDPASNDVAK
jgi:hypothetical protein